MQDNLNSNRNTARLAAVLFFFVCWPATRWSQGYVMSEVLVLRDAKATASNLLSNEFIFRTGIVGNLVNVVAFAWMALLLYRLFRPVDKHLSRMMVIPALVQDLILFILQIFNITALMTLKGEVLINVDESLKQELVYLLLRIHQYGMNLNQLFLGLWLGLLGILLYRSGFAPRIIGILAIIGGIGFVAEGCVFVLLQRPDYLVVRQFLKYTYLPGFIPMLWFLIKGVREQKAAP